MVMARLSARGPTGESAAPVGMELMMERIQELISAFKTQTKKEALRFKNTTSSHSAHVICIFDERNSVFLYILPHPLLETGTLFHPLACRQC